MPTANFISRNAAMTIERTNESMNDATTPLNKEQLEDLQPIEKAEEQVRGGDSTKPTESVTLNFGAIQYRNSNQ